MTEELNERLRIEIREIIAQIRDGRLTAEMLGLSSEALEFIKQMDDKTLDLSLSFLRFNIDPSGNNVPFAFVMQEPNVQDDGARLFYQRGTKALERERYVQAKQFLQKAVDIKPAFPEAWMALAKAYDGLGDHDRAAIARQMAT